MNYDSTGFLEEADYNDLKEIIEETGYEPFFFSEEENVSLPYPIYYIARQDCKIISFLSILPFDENCVEITGVTIPAYRHQGHFSYLLKMAMDTLSAIEGIQIFCGKEIHHPDIGCLFSHQECLMKLDKSVFYTTIHNMPVSGDTILEYQYSLEEDEIEWCYVLQHQDIPMGILKITMQPGCNQATLHHVAIRKKYRGYGYGKRLLTGALKQFFSMAENVQSILLHVTSNNVAAYSLYQSLGFTLLDSIPYYLLQK